MEEMGFARQSGEFGVGDLGNCRVTALVTLGPDSEPTAGGGSKDQAHDDFVAGTTSWLVSGPLANPSEMWLKIRCSMRFRLLVSGAK